MSTKKDVSEKLLWRILSRSVSAITESSYQLVTIIAGMKDRIDRSELPHASMISYKFELWSASGEREERDSPWP